MIGVARLTVLEKKERRKGRRGGEIESIRFPSSSPDRASPEFQNGLSRIRASVLSQIDGSVFGRTSWKEVVDTRHY